jgi:hypothetical protein
MRVVVDRPADHQVWDRAETIAGWIEGVQSVAGLRITCGGTPLPLGACVHPRGLGRGDVHGFWTELVVQRHVDAIRDGMLRLEIRRDETLLASVPLWIMPAARALAASHPLDLAEYAVPAASSPASVPTTIVFPGLGAVGGSSLGRLFRTRMLQVGGATPVYDEANAPALWARVRARRPASPYRWIDGHECYDAVPIGAGDAVRVTLLRDPIRRLVSIFNYGILVHPDRFAGAAFEEFVAAGEGRRHLQARALLRIAGREHELADAALHRAATRELATAYALVGITERFEETIFALCRLAGHAAIGMWRPVLAAPRAVDPDRLSTAARGRLTRDLAVDCEIYEEARARFHADVVAADFGAALARYRAAAALRRDLPATAKATECLRWRQVLDAHDRLPVGTAVATTLRDVIVGGKRSLA